MGRKPHCRQHILHAGLEVLATKGYNGTGVKEIVDSAGVPKGSFYNHFSSKEAFVIEAIELAAEEHLAAAKQQLLESPGSPIERLLRFFEQQLTQLQEQSFCGGCLIGNLSLEMSDENPAIRKATDHIMDQYVNLLASVIEQAKSEQLLKDPETDPHALAEFIQCAWEGTLMRLKTSRSCRAYHSFKAQIQQLLS